MVHELQTLLSVIPGNLEAMMDRLMAPSSARLRQTMADLQDEVYRLTRLVEDLRLLS